MQSKATTVADYLKELPEDRRKALEKLRRMIRKTAPEAKESMMFGMPGYLLGEPLVAMASQRNYMAVYVCKPKIVDAHRKRLGKLSCGKGCIRFKTIDELPLDVIEDILSDVYAECQAKSKSRRGALAPA